jgi:NhaP-type Na+/H+ or K+/H+ antiporter
MATLPSPLDLLLHQRDRLMDDLAHGRQLGSLWRGLVAVLIPAAGLYGIVLGGWHGGSLTFFVALKLPLVLLLTAALTMLFNSFVATLLGLDLRFSQVAVLTFFALAVASLLLASLAPIAWFFTLSVPEPSLAARTTHNLLYLLHTGFVGACGLAGTVVLWQGLVRIRGGAPNLKKAFAAWVLTFALVGGEVAWALRPFVGSIYKPIEFLRADALQGNVYEFIFTDILPYLRSKS